jgi:hypothetical protein
MTRPYPTHPRPTRPWTPRRAWAGPRRRPVTHTAVDAALLVLVTVASAGLVAIAGIVVQCLDVIL